MTSCLSPDVGGKIILILIIMILLQEDNIFGTDASLTYGPQFTNIDMLSQK